MNRMHKRALITVALVGCASLLTSCLTLDGFVFNPIHCSTVGPSTCEESGNPTWDQACVPCEEPYDWTRTYDWIEGTLDDGTPSVRAVDASSVVPLVILSDDGEAQLDAYYIPSHGGDPELRNTTVLYNHGNYMGIEHYAPRARFLHEAGYAVLIWDYRGFGKSLPDAAPTTEQFLADALTVRAFAEGIVPDPSKLIVYANSLGGIPAVEMSVGDPPCALMLEAAFTSMARISASNSGTSFGESMFTSNNFDNADKLRGYEGPLLMLVGDEDNFFPLEDERDLYDSAVGPKEFWVAEGAKHGISNGGVPEAGLTPYFAAMRSFLVEHAPGCLTP
ncbi:MAG: alpha/beta hydrolase [Deltaproteobacteria bacterium]|nr:alpha/beta hydrolase [Deltaproteobacteria bacterium]